MFVNKVALFVWKFYAEFPRLTINCGHGADTEKAPPAELAFNGGSSAQDKIKQNVSKFDILLQFLGYFIDS